MKRWCWLVGHEHNDTQNCVCGANSYDDPYGFWKYGIIWQIKYFYWNIQDYGIDRMWRSNFQICSDCHKPELIFGKFVGNHNDCIPF